MAYVTPTTRATGYVVLAANWNEFVNNFIAMAPDAFTANGDIYIGSAANTGVKLAAFTSSTGTLKHETGGLESDVSSGDGLVQVKAGATTVIKSNIAASSNPGTGDDTDDGYAIGSFWLNTTADRPYVCLDASSGAAVWKEMSGITNVVEDTSPQLGGNLDMQARLLVGNGGTTGIAIAADGAVTMALQPCVFAARTSRQTNVTGDGATATVLYNEELFDQGGDFNVSNGTFTAPLDGRYLVAVGVMLVGFTGVTHSDITGNIVETDRTIKLQHESYFATQTKDRIWINATRIINMDSGNTITIQVTVDGESSDVIDIEGSAVSNVHTSIGVYKVA